MNSNYTYSQNIKNIARHNTLFYAVDLLTTNRSKASCVSRNYVRKVWDYFNNLDECNEKYEAMKIDTSYIISWEKLHDSCLGFKHPEDLVVCYLSGPEPQNDFKELISLGIHPQNIWAFENNTTIYNKAVDYYNTLNFPQPKIVKGSIEQFFKYTPKKFDIVYIDACGAIASEQHCLRIIATLCRYHRLNSPGIVITNFASPDITKSEVINEYSDLIAKYLIFKRNPNMEVRIDNEGIKTQEYKNFLQEVNKKFQKYYGDFITASVRDIASVVIPTQRFVNSMYLKSISEIAATGNHDGLDIQKLNSIKNNSLYKFFYMSKLLKTSGTEQAQNNKRLNAFIKEFSGIDEYRIDIFDSFRILNSLKTDKSILNPDIYIINDHFCNADSIYQFLDKPSNNLFFDLVVNQFAYPMHYNSEAIKRYRYKAKETEMFMDILVFDECRYIYEWLPTIHQITNAFSNFSWQYIFRFALDGLVKQRINYNNEYFFQGSVTSKDIEEFKSKSIDERITIL